MQYGGGGHRFMKLFHKIPLFFERWLPLKQSLYVALARRGDHRGGGRFSEVLN